MTHFQLGASSTENLNRASVGSYSASIPNIIKQLLPFLIIAMAMAPTLIFVAAFAAKLRP